MPKLPNLIVKCLLKLSKIIEKLIAHLDIEKIFLSMHEYILSINHESKTPNDEVGIKMVKTIINEIVKIRRDDVWTPYTVIKVHRRPDNHINKWIQMILRSLQSQIGSTASSGV